MMASELLSVAQKFALEGKVLTIEPYGEGHINKTYLVTTTQKRYILQEMNTHIFPCPEELIANILAVTEFLKKKNIESLSLVKTKDDKPYLSAEKSYRVYDFIENTVTLQQVEDASAFRNAGYAFGCFQKALADFDASVLYEVIPQFHDTEKRYRDFCQALEADVCHRAAECQPEIAFLLSHKETYGRIMQGLREGRIPLRVTHNDTKLNNVLLDAKTREARAVIDLDTVMPGSLLYDFGDSIRFGASTAAEDEKNLDLVHFSLSWFRAYAEGYLSACGDSITEEEIRLLPYSAYLMTVECGMRFLTDYLSGDTYFATKYPGHNLVRCRTQLKLAGEMEEQEKDMMAVIQDILTCLHTSEKA